MRSTVACVLGVCLPLLITACTSGAPSSPDAPASPPSTSQPSEAALRTLLSDFAADSMEGRAAGTWGHHRATAYLAERARAIGLEPAGEEGSWFQEVPLRTRIPFTTAVLRGQRLQVPEDVVPIPPVDGFPHGAAGSVDGVPLVYGGRMLAPDEISAEEGRERVVVLGAALGPDGQPAYGVAPQVIEKFSGAAAVILASLDYAPPGVAVDLAAESALLGAADDEVEGPLLIFSTTEVAEALVGGPLDEVSPGTDGQPVPGEIGFRLAEPEAPTRNVIAVLPGSDPGLKNEYVVVSAHSDHLATVPPVADHDSLRAYLEVVRPRGAENPAREPTAEEAATIAEIRAAAGTERPPRPDSIRNGADDDGSGSVALLEIGRVLSEDPPRRSILFVWHTAEEVGLLGAEYFTDNPTVPLDNIVATLNNDMIGRGGADDLEEGGPAYAQLIGSRRLSTELGDLVEEVNRRGGHGFTFDYSYDADGHPDNYYCRSDHYMYARYGIPIVFFSTGGHRDYHQLTDEPQYIDYSKLARMAGLVARVAEAVANREQRVAVDGPIPDPDEPCRQ